MSIHRQVIQGILIGTICAMLIGCALPKVPSSASWDTDFAVPLAQHTYWLADVADTNLVRAQSGSGIGMTLPDSTLFFTYIQNLDPVRPGDFLRLDPLDYTIEKRFNTITVPLNVQQVHTATLGQMNPALAARNGTVSDVPAFPFQIIMDAPLGSNFSVACIDSGEARVTIRNTLPFAMSSLAVAWMADRDHAVPLFIGNLRAPQDTSYSYPLSGKCLNGTMFLEIDGLAAGGSQLLIDSTQGVIVTLSIGDVEVSSYTGTISRQSSVVDSTFNLDQQHDVTEAVIASGTLYVSANNVSPLADSVRLVLDNLRTPDGNVAVIEEYYDPAQSREFSYDLSGYVLRVTNPADQRVHGRLETVILASDGQVTFEADHQHVSTNFRTTELHFRRFTGVLHDLEAVVDPDSESVDQPPEGWENVHAADLNLKVTVGGGLTASGSMVIDLRSLRGGTMIGSQQRSAEFVLGRDTTLIFHGLEGLVTRIPEWIGYSGTVRLNGPVTVYDTTTIHGQVVLNAPLRFTLDNTHVPGEAQKVSPDPMDEIQEVTLKVKIWNALPLTGTLRLIGAFDSLAVLPNSGLAAETLCVVSLPSATLTDGEVDAAGFREVTVSPPPGAYEFLKHPPFYIRPDLTLNASDGDTLQANGTDYVKFSATANARYRVDTEGGK